jgi:transcriptional regulator with XRE-family HTH domain
VANDTVKRLVARVRELRKALGLTQEEFAERGGFDYKYYQHLEAGRKHNLKVSTLDKLAKACGIPLSDLFDFDSDPGLLAEDPPQAQTAKAPRRQRKR